MTDAILVTRAVTMRFGGLSAVKALTMKVPRGSLYGMIGPNGAGKTTVFNVLTGVYIPTEGEIDFDGIRVDGDDIVTRGFSGDISRWKLPKPEQVIEACGDRDRCAIVPK